MPGGGARPIDDDEVQIVMLALRDAQRHGLTREFMQWFLGALINNRLPVLEAIRAARIEWDF